MIDVQKAIEMAQKEKKTAILKVRLSEEQKDRFMAMCNSRDIDASSLIRAMIQQFIDSEGNH